MDHKLPPNMTYKASRDTYYLVQSVNGKRKWTSLGKRFNDALIKYGELTVGSTSDSGTFRELVGEYLKRAKFNNLAPATKEKYTYHLGVLMEVFGDAMVYEIEACDVFNYCEQRAVGSLCSARKEQAILRLVLALGVSKGWTRSPKYNGMCIGNAAQNAERQPKPEGRHQIISDDNWAALQAAANGNCIPIFMDLAFTTALRVGDILSLKWSDVTDEGILVTPGKTKKHKVKAFFKMNPALKAVLERAKSLHCKGNVQRMMRPDTHIIHMRTMQPYSYRSFCSLWQLNRIRANCEHCNIHDIRRTAITKASAAGIDPKAISLHKSDQMAAHYDQSVTQVSPLDPAMMKTG